ncbi:MAG: hypothetical protein CVU40_12815 [Chloroflexi bacterium HGW-Chloroflexi-2]|nr:MAG: hypothetical protein CVU40_12815 [Chloroflexi bacterium HGW-Chloroflexi-2]
MDNLIFITKSIFWSYRQPENFNSQRIGYSWDSRRAGTAHRRSESGKGGSTRFDPKSKIKQTPGISLLTE